MCVCMCVRACVCVCACVGGGAGGASMFLHVYMHEYSARKLGNSKITNLYKMMFLNIRYMQAELCPQNVTKSTYPKNSYSFALESR